MKKILLAVNMLIFCGLGIASQEIALTPDTYPSAKIIRDKSVIVNGEPEVMAVAFYYPTNTNFSSIVQPPNVVFEPKEYCDSTHVFITISRKKKNQTEQEAKEEFCKKEGRPIVALAKNHKDVATIILEENIKKNYALGQLQKTYGKLSARSIVRKEIISKLKDGVSDTSIAAAIISAIELSQKHGISSDYMPEVNFEIDHSTRKVRIKAPGLEDSEKTAANSKFANDIGVNEIEVI